MTGFIKQTLTQLLASLPFEATAPSANPMVTGITLDSRQVQPGNIFIALSGANNDGHRFIADAVAHGASAVVGSQAGVECGVPYIQVSDTRLALAHLSAAFYSFPGRQLTVIGVTGTDGKTTTANLVYQILQHAGFRSGIISTVNATIGGDVVDTGLHVTTPEAPDVQRYLARMLDAGLTHVVLEATSHGLSQQRVTGCEFDVGVVTNITHEHLDYHGSFGEYRQAKGRLFTSLAETHAKAQGNPRAAVLNHDDSSYEYLHGVSPAFQISYGLHPGAALWANEIDPSPSGLKFKINGLGAPLQVQSSLVGLFNVCNILAAVGATVKALGVPAEAAQLGVLALTGVAGRMERIDLGQDFYAIVDFAHTPNAMQQALSTVRQMTRGRVIAVFGSAGLRDRQKRRMMAEVSAELADISILTAEDPRTESLDGILAEMAAGAESRGGVEGKSFYRVPDRGEALRLAVRLAQPGDVVVTCGKGHEQSMCFGVQEFPWDDRTALRAALGEHLGSTGPCMPYLPTKG